MTSIKNGFFIFMFPDTFCLRTREGFRKHYCMFCPRRAIWVLHSGEQYCSRCRDLALDMIKELLKEI